MQIHLRTQPSRISQASPALWPGLSVTLDNTSQGKEGLILADDTGTNLWMAVRTWQRAQINLSFGPIREHRTTFNRNCWYEVNEEGLLVAMYLFSRTIDQMCEV